MSFPTQVALLDGIKVIQEGESTISIENETKKDKKVKTDKKTSSKTKKTKSKRRNRRLPSNKANVRTTKKRRTKQIIGDNTVHDPNR